jgi:hypothetical protein
MFSIPPPSRESCRGVGLAEGESPGKQRVMERAVIKLRTNIGHRSASFNPSEAFLRWIMGAIGFQTVVLLGALVSIINSSQNKVARDWPETHKPGQHLFFRIILEMFHVKLFRPVDAQNLTCRKGPLPLGLGGIVRFFGPVGIGPQWRFDDLPGC